MSEVNYWRRRARGMRNLRFRISEPRSQKTGEPVYNFLTLLNPAKRDSAQRALYLTGCKLFLTLRRLADRKKN